MCEESWENNYVEAAEKTVQDTFTKWYLHLVATSVHTDRTSSSLSNQSVWSQMQEQLYGARSGCGDGDELDRYLSEPPAPKDIDVLSFWEGRKDLPLLQRMVRHYLCVPAMSAASEWVFSMGQDIIGDWRACLGPQRISQLTLLKLWKQTMPEIAVKALE